MPEEDEMDGTNGGWTVFVQAKKYFSPGSGSLLHGSLSQWRLTCAQNCVCLLRMSGSTVASIRGSVGLTPSFCHQRPVS